MPERLDTESMPLTEPHWPPTFDTGPHPKPLNTAEPDPEPQPDPDYNPWRLDSSADPVSWSEEIMNAPEPQVVPAAPVAHPVSVPGQYQYVKRWKFGLALLGVWIVAAAAGAGFYYWWYQSLDKTWPDFAVLIYVLVCTVAALLVSMVQDRPMLSATSIAVMSAPFASGVAAAALYGMYVFGWVTP